MKKVLFTLFSMFCFINIYAQKIELRVSANSGLFSFAGNSAESSSLIIVGNGNNYTNNPYGTKNGLAYGISANAKKVFAKHLLLGLDFGYEMMSSKVNIDGVSGIGFTGSSNLPTSGETRLNTQFLNLHPNFGFRFGQSQTTIDLTAGMDVGFILKATEKGEATATGMNYTTSVDRKNLKTDIRPRVQVAVNYQKFGIYGGYSYGLSNYMEGYIGGGPWEAKSRIVRFGLSYRIN